jgi:hypothetical protein
MATNKNILDTILQAPGSLASRALQGVANTAQNEEGKTGDISRSIVNFLSDEENVSKIEKLDKPYRVGVARPMSTFLQTIKDIGQDGLSPRETWDRSWERSKNGVTIGQASIGLVARYTPGKQGADKIDWSNKKSVTAYFEKDNTAAERISGAIDGTMNFFFDPLVLGGKAAKLTRLGAMGVRGTQIKGPLKFGRDNLAKLVDEADAAKAGKENSVSIVADSIESNINNFLALESVPIIANSQNPTAVARAMNEAYATGGRAQIFEVLKAGLGDETAIATIKAQDSILSETLYTINGGIKAVENQIKGIPSKSATGNNPKLTPSELKNLEESKARLIKGKEATQARIDAGRTVVSVEDEGGVVGKLGAELAWSRSKKIEYLRAKSVEANSSGWFTDYDASVDSLGAAALHKFDPDAMRGTTFRVLRTVGYFGRNYKAREIPAGSVTIAGEIGDFANKEFRARIISAAKNAGFSAKQQQAYYNSFSALKTDSARFQLLERFEEEALTAILKRSVNTKGMTKEQLKVLNETFLYIARDIGTSKRAKLKEIANDQNYVNVDSRSGESYIVKDVRDSVQRTAEILARNANRPVQPGDIAKAKGILSGTALTRTQVPNVHYGVDFQKIAEILGDEKTLVSTVASLIKDDPNIKSTDIKKVIERAKIPGISNEGSALGTTREVAGEFWHEKVKYGYEGLQNYLWKPAVLLSLRYTSRNVLEGWARSVASFADMTSHQGYSLRTLVSGFDVLEMGSAKLQNVYNTVSQTVKYKGIAGTGGARAQLRNARNEKFENEVEIGRNFGALPEDSPQVVVEKITKRYKEEAEYFLNTAQDVLSSSIEFSRQEFVKIGKYKGNPEAVKASRKISKLGQNIFNVPASQNVSNPFLTAMRDGDYGKAYAIAVDSDPEIIFNSLEQLTKRADSAIIKINELASTINLNRTPSLKAQLESVQETLELIKQNADVTKMAFDSTNRQSIMSAYNKALEVSSAKPEKVRAFSQNRVKISKNATIDPAMAKEMRYETVSAANSTSKAVLNSRRNTLTRLTSTGKQQTTAQPTDDFWTSGHAEYMNNILYGDDAGKFIIDLSVSTRSIKNPHVAAKVADMKKARKSKKEIDDYLSSRYSEDEIKNSVLDWIKSTDSNAWRSEKYLDLVEYRKKGLDGIQWSYITDTIGEEIHRYLPMTGPSGEDLSFLRQALVDGKFDDTFSARIPMGYREPVYVNAEAGSGKNLKNVYKNAVGNLFHMLATMPEDFAVRHPFYNAVYKAEGERLAKQFAKQGVDVSTRSKEIQNAAHAAALKAVNDRLYTVERFTNVGQLSRFIEPFYMAKQNTTKFWIPAMVRNPEIAVRFVQAFTLPYKLATVYDREDNNKVVNQIGHPWNTKGKVMIFEYPQWMKERFFGGDSDAFVQVPLSGFDVVFQGQPIGVPQIGSPIGNLFLGPIMRGMVGKPYDPAKFLEKHGIADLDKVIKYVQPYYEATSGENTVQQITGAFGSGSVALESLMVAIGGQAGMFANTTGGQKFHNRLQAIEADKLAKLSASGVAVTGVLIQQIREESLALTTKSFYAEAFTNGLPLVATTRYKTYYEVTGETKLRALRDEFGYDLGTAKYTEEVDSQQAQYIANLISDSTTDNRFGFNSSEATLEGIYANQQLLDNADLAIADTSLIGALFNQGDFTEDRSDIASDVLFEIRVNGEPIKYKLDNPGKYAEDNQVRAGNKDYFAGIEIIEQHAEDRGIKKGTKAYKEFYGVWKENWSGTIGERYPQWLVRDRTIRLDRVEKNLFAAQTIVNDSNYMSTVGSKNPVALAVAEYLRGRVKLQEELARASAASGYKTIDAQDNAYVAQLRDNYVASLEQKYPGFQRVHEIYFNNDKLAPIEFYATGYGFGGTE